MCRNKCFVSSRNIPLVCIQAKEHILILGEILAPFKTCNYLGFSITHEWQPSTFSIGFLCTFFMSSCDMTLLLEDNHEELLNSTASEMSSFMSVPIMLLL